MVSTSQYGWRLLTGSACSTEFFAPIEQDLSAAEFTSLVITFSGCWRSLHLAAFVAKAAGYCVQLFSSEQHAKWQGKRVDFTSAGNMARKLFSRRRAFIEHRSLCEFVYARQNVGTVDVLFPTCVWRQVHVESTTA